MLQLLLSSKKAPGATMRKITLLFYLFFGCITLSGEINWHKQAEISVNMIKEELKANHPAGAESSSNAFSSWLETADKTIADKLTQVHSLSSYQSLLQWYAKGFNDSHLRVSFKKEKITEDDFVQWPGFLVEYNSVDKKFYLTESIDEILEKQGHLDGHSFNFKELLKINDENVKAWIDKNCTPFYNGPIQGCESAYVKMAPFALVTTNNPFALKPKTITVQSTGSCRCIDGGKSKTVTINLENQRITSAELSTKVSTARKFDPNKKAFLSIFNDDNGAKIGYVRIPTLAPQNKSEETALLTTIKKMPKSRTCKTVIFDIRNCFGGSSEYADQLLKKLFGIEYVDQKRSHAETNVSCDWRASQGNIKYLRHTALNGHPLLILSEKAKKWFSTYSYKLETALKKGDVFYTEPKESEQIETPAEPLSNPNIIFIIDAQNGSAALDFIDYAKACALVKLIGEPTSADSVYMEVRRTEIKTNEPNTDFTLDFPIKVYRNRPRGHNQPYLPDIAMHLKSYPTKKDAAQYTNDLLKRILCLKEQILH